MDSDVNMISPFHASARAYAEAGYFPIPLPAGDKFPPVKGTPNGLDLDAASYNAQLERWLSRPYIKNIGTVIPDDVVVVDVDGRDAEATLRDIKRKYGKLPETWMTYRGNTHRYHLWFRTPTGMTWPGKLADGIDILYRHYRYAVLPPSRHPDGQDYYWALPTKNGRPEAITGYFPSIDELSDMPDDWLVLGSTAPYQVRERITTDVKLWLRENGQGKCCTIMKKVGRQVRDAITQAADKGGCHDSMVNAVWAIISEIMHGHTGGIKALKIIKAHFIEQITSAGRRDTDDAENEWMRALIGAVEKQIANQAQVSASDPCINEDNEDIDPDQFFDQHGLMSRTLRKTVEKHGGMAIGPGKTIYRYHAGLWTPDGESEIARRTERLLGERYRPSHVQNVTHAISARVPLINDDNQDTQFINVPNGLLDWKERKLYPHSSAIMSTTRIPVIWNPKAKCPNIDKFINEVFPPDAQKLAYQVLGYMLFNGNPLHKAILLYGSGRNGKGTYLRLARMLAGGNNIAGVTPQALDSSPFSSAQIYGKLANLVGDVDPKLFKGTEQFKQLTGGDYLMAQHKYGQPFLFQARALMIAAFNKLPSTTDTTEGFFSRWVVVPFNAHFPDGVADPNLIERLTRPEELQGLLVRAIQGLNEVMKAGRLDTPASVQKAHSSFRKESDPLQHFISESIKVTGNRKDYVLHVDVYTAYVAWCMSSGYRPQARLRFIEAIKSLMPSVKVTRRQDRYAFIGIHLTESS